jgi:hypothetical protein
MTMVVRCFPNTHAYVLLWWSGAFQILKTLGKYLTTNYIRTSCELREEGTADFWKVLIKNQNPKVKSDHPYSPATAD